MAYNSGFELFFANFAALRETGLSSYKAGIKGNLTGIPVTV